MNIWWNVVRSFIRFKWAKLRGYQVLASPVVADYRFQNHCQSCVWFDGAQCERCGCLAMAKTMIAVEECPAGLWPAIWRKKNLTRR